MDAPILIYYTAAIVKHSTGIVNKLKISANQLNESNCHKDVLLRRQIGTYGDSGMNSACKREGQAVNCDCKLHTHLHVHWLFLLSL